MTINYVRVQNQTMPRSMFDALCDELSSTRRCSMDYRMVRGFNPLKEKPYWHSNSYPDFCTTVIQAAHESVREDVRKFCEKHSADVDSVLVEIASATV